MRCPFCYEKMNKYTNVCPVCGFKKDDLKTASNSLVPKYRKKDPESVIYITELPSDLSGKKLFFLCLFGGMIGLHSFYTKRYVRALVSVFFTLVLLVGTPFVYGDMTNIESIVIYDPVLTSIVGIAGAIAFFMWFSDFVGIIFKRFKIPAVLKDRI